MATTISDVMTPNPATCSPGDRVRDAARAMDEGDFGAVVVEEGGEVRGIVTDRDIVVRAIAAGMDPESTTLGEICTAELTTLSPGDSIDEAVDALRQSHIRRLPVVDGSSVVGIVSIGDLAQARDERSALADISAAAPNN